MFSYLIKTYGYDSNLFLASSEVYNRFGNTRDLISKGMTGLGCRILRIKGTPYFIRATRISKRNTQYCKTIDNRIRNVIETFFKDSDIYSETELLEMCNIAGLSPELSELEDNQLVRVSINGVTYWSYYL